MEDLATKQRELFQIFDDLFRLGMGTSAEEFAPVSGFNKEFARCINARKIEAAVRKFIPILRSVYSQNGELFYRSAIELGGLKVLLGGTVQFGPAQLQAVRKLVLYSDTVLISDPVSALLEEGIQERAPCVQIFVNLFFLLRL